MHRWNHISTIVIVISTPRTHNMARARSLARSWVSAGNVFTVVQGLASNPPHSLGWHTIKWLRVCVCEIWHSDFLKACKALNFMSAIYFFCPFRSFVHMWLVHCACTHHCVHTCCVNNGFYLHNHLILPLVIHLLLFIKTGCTVVSLSACLSHSSVRLC